MTDEVSVEGAWRVARTLYNLPDTPDSRCAFLMGANFTLASAVSVAMEEEDLEMLSDLREQLQVFGQERCK